MSRWGHLFNTLAGHPLLEHRGWQLSISHCMLEEVESQAAATGKESEVEEQMVG